MDIMLDLETLGLRTATAPIVAIGAICFDPKTNTLGNELYWKVNLESSCRNGAVIEADTALWWLRQSDAARAELTGAGIPFPEALRNFSAWIHGQRDDSVLGAIRVWGDGSSFDNALLMEAYERMGYTAPWSRKEDRCYRTLKNMRPDIVRAGGDKPHNALEDARMQALHAMAILRAGVPPIN